MMKIINLTQHNATPAQVAAGVFEPRNKEAVKDLLTFHEPPSPSVLWKRADALARVAQESGAKMALIGGAPYFMSTLEKELINAGVIPVYSFSERKTIEKAQADGTVKKVSVFEHVGFVSPTKQG